MSCDWLDFLFPASAWLFPALQHVALLPKPGALQGNSGSILQVAAQSVRGIAMRPSATLIPMRSFALARCSRIEVP